MKERTRAKPNGKPGRPRNRETDRIARNAGVSKRAAEMWAREHGEETATYAEAKRLKAIRDAAMRAIQIEREGLRREQDKLALEERRGKLVDKAAVRDDAVRIAVALGAEFDRVAADLPSLIAGKDEAGAHEVIVAVFDGVRARVAKLVKGWA